MENCEIEYEPSTGRAPRSIVEDREERISSTKKEWLTGIEEAAKFIHNPNELDQDWILRNFGSTAELEHWGAAIKQLATQIKKVIDAIPWDTCSKMNETIFKNKIKPYAIRFFNAEILRADAVRQSPHALGPPGIRQIMHESRHLANWLSGVWLHLVRWPEAQHQQTTVLSPAAFAAYAAFADRRRTAGAWGGRRRKTAKRKKYYQKKKRTQRKRTQRKRTQRKRTQRKRKSRRRKIRVRR